LKATPSKSTSATTEFWGLRLRSFFLAVVSTLLSIAACGGDDLFLPKDGEPAHIAAVGPDDLRGTVGQALSDSLVVEVTDPSGRPVSGVEVSFVLPAGAAVAPGDRVNTGSNGRAAVYYTLSTAAGEQVVEAHAPIVPASNAVATFRVLADPEGPVALMADSGDGQRAQVSTVLPVPLAVKAVDRFNNGVAGVEVTWRASGDGEVDPASGVTGTDGRAVTSWTLGSSPGSNEAVAQAEDLEGSPVSFTATAVAAPRPELVLVTEPSATAAAGVPLERQPEIQLRDPFGIPLNQEGVSVTVQIATGEGSLGGRTTASSDANGMVRFSDLEFRGETGSRTLIFAADGFTPVTSSAITVRPGPPSADQSSVSVPNGTAGASTAITVRLRDEFGNNISDAGDALDIRIDGANPSSGLPITDRGDGAYSTSYTPVHTGTDAVTVEFRGTPLSGSPFQSVVSPGAADPSTTSAQVTRNGIFFVSVSVVVTTRDSQGNLLGHGGDQVQVIPNGGPPRLAVDNGDGTYTDSFVIIADVVSVDILLNGVAIAGSPFIP
jgi:hypothetical protein